MTAPRCPCGHPLNEDGDPSDYICLNGKIYGPCVEDHVCNGGCIDGYGNCHSWDGCCDPEEEIRSQPRRCESEACDEFDGIHCYGDGCAMARKEDPL